MKKKIISLTVLFLSLSIGIGIYFLYSPVSLTFKVDALSSEDIPILVENEPVVKKGDFLNSITLTTTRPISITIGKETRHIKVDKLSKMQFIPIDIVFKDKKKSYYLQTLPQTFPSFFVKNTFAVKGYVLISLHGSKLVDPPYIFILDMDGRIVFYRGHPEVYKSIFHLKKVVLPNGKVRYITHVQSGWGLDASYVVGYHSIMDAEFRELDRVTILKTQKHASLLADEHDILMLDDGHYIVTGQDVVKSILPDGTESLITHTVVQEQKNRQVLLDWDSKDYPELQKACYEKCPELSKKNADYVHANSLFIDPKDNNLLVSSASGYYIMKLNRKTGEIMWILGGKANQFQMHKDAEFIRQHHIQILPDGKLMMFDNHMASLSFDAMKYHRRTFDNDKAQILILGLDEQNKKVTSVQRIPLNFWAPHMGSVQKLDDGWFVGCGGSKECTVKLIDTSGDVLWDMKANKPYTMYRSYFYERLD